MDKYPAIAPYVFVTPTATTLIRENVATADANGKVNLRYLIDWKKGLSNLKGLVEIMCSGNHTSEDLGTIVHFSI